MDTNAVRRALRREVRSQRKESVEKLYLCGLTYGEIAKQLGISAQRVFQIIKPPSRIRIFIKQRAKSKCEICNLHIKNGSIHHKEHVSGYNNPENLAYLCNCCHAKLHWGNSQPGDMGRPRISETPLRDYHIRLVPVVAFRLKTAGPEKVREYLEKFDILEKETV